MMSLGLCKIHVGKYHCSSNSLETFTAGLESKTSNNITLCYKYMKLHPCSVNPPVGLVEYHLKPLVLAFL